MVFHTGGLDNTALGIFLQLHDGQMVGLAREARACCPHLPSHRFCRRFVVPVADWTAEDALLTFNNGGNVSSLGKIERASENADGKVHQF